MDPYLEFLEFSFIVNHILINSLKILNFCRRIFIYNNIIETSKCVFLKLQEENIDEMNFKIMILFDVFKFLFFEFHIISSNFETRPYSKIIDLHQYFSDS